MYNEGLTVIIPIHHGRQYMEQCFLSLNRQSLDPSKFEVLLVFNGDFREDLAYFNSTKRKYHFNYLIYTTPVASAGHARNIAIGHAAFSHTTFIDIDDYISTNYLESMYTHLENRTVVINSIMDVIEGKKTSSLLAEKLQSYTDLYSIHQPLTITVCKAIPTDLIKQHRFVSEMKSGEDVVFFVDFFTRHKVTLHINHDAYYYRVKTAESVSRQKLSYDFNIKQRLKSYQELNKLLTDPYPRTNTRLIKTKINAQNIFILNYLKEYPEDYNKVMAQFTKYHFQHVNTNNITYELINQQFLELVKEYPVRFTSRADVPSIISSYLYKLLNPDCHWTCDIQDYVAFSVTLPDILYQSLGHHDETADKLYAFIEGAADEIKSTSSIK
ncbi:glycosyltransferase family A protein [Macrococcus lamae]|uniref:Glycosyltransferase family 2 protein n=1 Tax=Macrococcus lamae TaxID=198484 RepID=A0A4R6BVB5_9STAP|nr:glycosyltransferase family 2 protein [Macrococcus lamae]TDM12288.1 glycosyltransferase family 2 protein [Macrococcus lamae]